MADAMRAMLDELMGKDRDLPAEEREERAKKRHFTEERVCKYFICGFCPHEVFSITKRDMGPCPNEHDKEMKALYESDPKNVTKYGFEDDMARFLRKMIADVNHKVAMGRQRVTRPPPPPNPEMQAKIQEIEDQIQELNVKAELAGEAGNVDEAQGHAAMIETLTAKMLRLQEDAKKDMFGAYKDKEQIVCDVCGAIEDAVVVEARAAADEGAPLLSKAAQDHINGKQHRGFKMIRDWVDEYEKRKLQRLEELERERDRDRGRGHSDRDAPRRERDRGLSPDRRDRDRYDRRDDYDRRDRDRGRTDRDSGRDRRRSRSRDRYDRRR